VLPELVSLIAPTAAVVYDAHFTSWTIREHATEQRGIVVHVFLSEPGILQKSEAQGIGQLGRDAILLHIVILVEVQAGGCISLRMTVLQVAFSATEESRYKILPF
jgi:hypothetical protein